MSREKQADLPKFDVLGQPGRDAQLSADSDNESLADLGGKLVAEAPLSSEHAETADLSDLYGERSGMIVPSPDLSE